MSRDFACGMEPQPSLTTYKWSDEGSPLDAAVTNAYEVLLKAKLQDVKSTGCRFYINSQNSTQKMPSAFFASDRQQPTANSQQPTANSQQPTANSQQPTANSQQPTANYTHLKKIVSTIQ